jgi:hypothetical protein
MSMPILSPLTFLFWNRESSWHHRCRTSYEDGQCSILLADGEPGCKSSPVFLSNSQSQIFSYQSVDLAEKLFTCHFCTYSFQRVIPRSRSIPELGVCTTSLYDVTSLAVKYKWWCPVSSTLSELEYSAAFLFSVCS